MKETACTNERAYKKAKGVKLKILVNDSQTNRHKAILAFVNEERSVIAFLKMKKQRCRVKK